MLEVCSPFGTTRLMLSGILKVLRIQSIGVVDGEVVPNSGMEDVKESRDLSFCLFPCGL